jgi:hypothetical protein
VESATLRRQLTEVTEEGEALAEAREETRAEEARETVRLEQALEALRARCEALETLLREATRQGEHDRAQTEDGKAQAEDARVPQGGAGRSPAESPRATATPEARAEP